MLMSLTSYAMNFFLTFTNFYLIIPFVLLGYAFFSEKFFGPILQLVVIGILSKNALKVTFQWPLPPSVGHPGFGFPSGHMQLAMMIYGSLFVKTASPFLRLAIFILLPGIGWSLVAHGYHYPIDIAGSVFFSSVLIAAYQFMEKRHTQILPWCLIALNSFLLGYLFIRQHATWLDETLYALGILCVLWEYLCPHGHRRYQQRPNP